MAGSRADIFGSCYRPVLIPKETGRNALKRKMINIGNIRKIGVYQSCIDKSKMKCYSNNIASEENKHELLYYEPT